MLLDVPFQNTKFLKYTPDPCPDGIEGYWVSTDEHIKNVPTYINQKCTGNSADARRDIPGLSTYVELSSDFSRNHCSNDVEYYNWNSKICLGGVYDEEGDVVDIRSEDMVNVNIRPEDKSMRHKRILFIGDSHMRGLAAMFLYWTCGYEYEPMNENNINQGDTKRVGDKDIQYFERTLSKLDHWKYAQKMEKEEGRQCSLFPDAKVCNLFSLACTDTTVAFLAIHDCNIDGAKFFKSFDYVVVNCGHHPASSLHYSFEKFDKTTAVFFREVKEYQKEDSVLIWLENTAQPLRADHFVKEYKDWRTLHRLILFDAIAKDNMEAAGLNMRIIPAFSSTLALYDKMCDCSHYSVVAKMPQLIRLLDILRS